MSKNHQIPVDSVKALFPTNVSVEQGQDSDQLATPFAAAGSSASSLEVVIKISRFLP